MTKLEKIGYMIKDFKKSIAETKLNRIHSSTCVCKKCSPNIFKEVE